MESPLCQPDTRLIETFGWDGKTFPRLSLHLARLAASALTLGFTYDPGTIKDLLPIGLGSDPMRVRLTLGQAGDVEITLAPLAPNPAFWRVAIAQERLTSFDPLLRHKTTERALYDQTRASLPSDVDEMIFINEKTELAEGTITNIFFDLGEGLCTPPLASGCLPGCLRAELLAAGEVREAILKTADLSRAQLWLGNSLRGLVAARLT